MKIYKRLLSVLLVLSMLFALTINTFAADYSEDEAVPGLSGIQPDDTLTLPENTVWATLTAVWGVRVTFLDWKDNEISSVVVREGENVEVPTAPTRTGYTFTGWSRIDEAEGTAVLGDDLIENVQGPGPLVYKANYLGVLDGQTSGTITVINATHGNKYAGYKIFDASINPDNIDAIIYTIREDSPWYEFVQDYFDLTEWSEDEDVAIYQANPKDGFDPKTFFENLPTEGVTPDLEPISDHRDGIIKWEDVPFGYYAITSTLGSWVTVNTNNPFATVIDKNQTAVLDKNIVEDNGEKVKTNTASFGESVNFDIDVFAGDFNKNELVTYYHIKDTIDSGFDYDFTDSKNVTVKVTGTQKGTQGEDPYEFTLSPVDSLNALQTAKSGYYLDYTEGSRSFEVVVKWATLDENNNLMPVYEDEFNYLHVIYSATVNNDAVIAGDGNLNTASFTFDKTSGFDPENPPTEEPTPGENPVDPNTPVNTTTYVYALAIEKVDAKDTTKHLPGVKFTTEDFLATKISDGVYEVIGENDTTSTAVEYFEVPESGIILIKGLGAGEYSFVESEALPGYNRLAEPLVMTVSASAETVKTIGETPCAAFQQVENASGTELPSTGGMGTVLFITIGAILFMAAGIVLTAKKRLYNEG